MNNLSFELERNASEVWTTVKSDKLAWLGDISVDDLSGLPIFLSSGRRMTDDEMFQIAMYMNSRKKPNDQTDRNNHPIFR